MKGILLAVALSTGTQVIDVPGGRALVTAPAELTVHGSFIDLKFGRLLLALPKLGGRKFSVRTANAVAAVRGTEFFVDARKGETYVCACEGKLQVGKTPMAAAREKRHFSKLFKGGRVVDENPGLQGHADAEFPSLRSR